LSSLHSFPTRRSSDLVAIGRRGETGFDHVDAQALELLRDAHLLFVGHRRAGALLAVAQRGVENDQMIGHAASCNATHGARFLPRSEEHTSELQSLAYL